MMHLLAFAALVQQDRLQVDPLLLVQAAEVWSVIGRKDNPVWPGWDARHTPILVYFPGKQDVLINHPKPPDGFKRYTGAVRSPIGPIFVKDGPTIKDMDGQNTSAEVGGVGTLVVADTLSSRRQWIESLAGQFAEHPENATKVITDGLFPDPYGSMTVFAHEAFHVYQEKLAPNKSAKELDVLKYPALSVENNVGFALESDFLAETAKAKTLAEVRAAAVKWLATRKWRRAGLSEASTRYEDGNEFNEGLAEYVQYKLLECLQTKTPSQEMWLVQGFQGYGDLQPQRDQMMRQMQMALTGQMNVNNDPYGASPVRFRLYFSGMAIGAMLDRLGAKWHDAMLKTDATLTSLAEKAVQATPEELHRAKAEVQSSPRFKELTDLKLKLAKDGEAHIQKVLAGFDSCPGELEIDYSKAAKPAVAFVFTPFGVLRVSDDQTVYRLIPMRGRVGSLTVSEDGARPVLHDQGAKVVRYQLTATPDEAALKLQLGGGGLQAVDAKTLALPGVTLGNVKGTLIVEGRKVTLVVAD